mmetsp:Transcript_11306/g.47126  ORF Transcript_11306/g.47126 Transcript_11306/m.47126 type:complete len:88 (+) Transcript_11306:250-513(+)
MVRTRGSSSSESDERLRDFPLPPVFSCDTESYQSFPYFAFPDGNILDLKCLWNVTGDPSEATDAEKQYVSAVPTRRPDGPAINLAVS